MALTPAQGWHLTPEGLLLCKNSLDTALNLDLKEIGAGCLPDDVNRGKLETLSGGLVLQVSKIRNVSAPKINEESGAAPRMLKMSLTDGKVTCHAIELSKVDGISLDTPPGTKVKLLKDIPISNGYLLLETGSIKVIGGRVEALAGKWEIGQQLAQFSKIRSTGPQEGAEGGPPAWIPFGKKITRAEAGDKDFKALGDQSAAAGSKENAEFDSQRKDAILEATKTLSQKVFGAGSKDIKEAEHPKRRKDRQGSEEANSQVEVTNGGEREGSSGGRGGRGGDGGGRRRGKGERGGRNRDDDGQGVGASQAKPSGNVSLFAFLEEKLPGDPDAGKKEGQRSNNQSDRQTSGKRTDKNFAERNDRNTAEREMGHKDRGNRDRDRDSGNRNRRGGGTGGERRNYENGYPRENGVEAGLHPSQSRKRGVGADRGGRSDARQNDRSNRQNDRGDRQNDRSEKQNDRSEWQNDGQYDRGERQHERGERRGGGRGRGDGVHSEGFRDGRRGDGYKEGNRGDGYKEGGRGDGYKEGGGGHNDGYKEGGRGEGYKEGGRFKEGVRGEGFRDENYRREGGRGVGRVGGGRVDKEENRDAAREENKTREEKDKKPETVPPKSGRGERGAAGPERGSGRGGRDRHGNEGHRGPNQHSSNNNGRDFGEWSNSTYHNAQRSRGSNQHHQSHHQSQHQSHHNHQNQQPAQEQNQPPVATSQHAAAPSQPAAVAAQQQQVPTTPSAPPAAVPQPVSLVVNMTSLHITDPAIANSQPPLHHVGRVVEISQVPQGRQAIQQPDFSQPPPTKCEGGAPPPPWMLNQINSPPHPQFGGGGGRNGGMAGRQAWKPHQQPPPMPQGIHQWHEGDEALARYWEDGKFYPVKVTAVSTTTAVVLFKEYGNHEEVVLQDLIPHPVANAPGVMHHGLRFIPTTPGLPPAFPHS